MGYWEISVGGCYQTAFYTIRMWHKALKRLPKKANIKNVLILGLGAGGNIFQLYKKFPYCQITAIEFDPVMAEIAQKTFLSKVKRQPRIILGNVLEILPGLNEKYDLILIDLFVGKKPSQVVINDILISRLQQLLQFSGYLLLNVFGNTEIFEIYNKYFSNWEIFKYRINKLALYRHFGNGQVGDPLPINYLSYKQCKEYLAREISDKKRELVGLPHCYGLRWHHGPWHFEGYISDAEPIIAPYAQNRLIIWQPISRLDCPKGWHRSWIQMNPRKTGFAELNLIDYWQNWNKNAQRQRQKWLKNNEYEIMEVDTDEFIKSYSGIKKAALLGLKSAFIKILKEAKAQHNDYLHCYIARRKDNKIIVGGLAVLDIPEASQSHHFISYLYPEGEKQGAGTGLIDHWFIQAIKQNYKFLDFGNFWALGNSRAWQGFSRFKGQFGTHYIAYPFPLMRWVRKNKK